MSSIFASLKQLPIRLARSAGIYIDRYHPDYQYISKSMWIAKRRVIAPLQTPFNTLDEDGFYTIAEPVIEANRVLLGLDRLFILWQAVRNVCRLRLPAAEVGSFRGGSAYFLASAFRRLVGAEIPIHIFDTFEGHPDEVVTEMDPYHAPGKFCDTDYEDVKVYLSEFLKLEIHKGEFSETVKALPEMAFGLVHLDVDIYQSTLDGLEYFSPRLARGGVIIVDDYKAPKCPGVDRALTEYLHRHSGKFHVWHPQTEQLVMVRI